MNLKDRKIGLALTGSFCTFENTFTQLEILVKEGADVYPIFSFSTQNIDSRFGRSESFLRRAEELCEKKVITTIAAAEPIGPKGYLDVLAILPCTGNTIAKLAGGITDTPTLMAAKAHLRNEKPLVLSVSTNDALSMNLKNIGMLMNIKNIYFVPFGQDNPVKKPNSMIAHTDMLIPTLKKALEHKQLQPVVISPFKEGV
jgi:dipicolinate synthase subunit B